MLVVLCVFVYVIVHMCVHLFPLCRCVTTFCPSMFALYMSVEWPFSNICDCRERMAVPVHSSQSMLKTSHSKCREGYTCEWTVGSSVWPVVCTTFHCLSSRTGAPSGDGRILANTVDPTLWPMLIAPLSFTVPAHPITRFQSRQSARSALDLNGGDRSTITHECDHPPNCIP